MGLSLFKVEYECDCGVDYGSCGAKCAIIMKMNRTVDVYHLYHTDSHEYTGNKEKPKTTEGGLDCFGDSYLTALGKLLEMKDANGQTLTETERDVVLNRASAGNGA